VQFFSEIAAAIRTQKTAPSVSPSSRDSLAKNKAAMVA